MPALDAVRIERLLDVWPVARLATRTPVGAPHLVPIVFARSAGALWSPIDGKPKSGAPLARVRHLSHDRRVSLLLDHYDDDWTRLWWIRVDGTAETTGGDPGAEAALRAKYPQYRTTPLFRDAPALIRIAPIAVVSWTATSR